MEEDRPDLGVGLRGREWPVSRDQQRFSGCHRRQAVAAGIAIDGRNVALGRDAVGIGRTHTEGFHVGRLHGDKTNGHAFSSHVRCGIGRIFLRQPYR
jgi:hypothetical protein